MLESKCKKCRRSGEKLFLKGERCFTPKCTMVKRSYPSGIHGKKKRRKITTYARQLLEKQKLKQAYGVQERQFKKYFLMALKKKGSTPETLAKLLELRFDNIVFRLGFVSSKSTARQLISHGHFLLNKKKHTIASTILKVGDNISLRPQSLERSIFKNIKARLEKISLPKYLLLDREKIEGKVVAEPDLEELKLPFDFPAVIEFYSK